MWPCAPGMSLAVAALSISAAWFIAAIAQSAASVFWRPAQNWLASLNSATSFLASAAAASLSAALRMAPLAAPTPFISLS